MRLHMAGRHWAAALAALAVAVAAGCGRREPTDLQEFAAALRREGVAYEVSETAALRSIRAEGLRLTGPALEVEIYVIEDEGDLANALTAAARMADGQRASGVPRPARGYGCRDVFVLVYEEPVEGGVREALARIAAE